MLSAISLPFCLALNVLNDVETAPKDLIVPYHTTHIVVLLVQQNSIFMNKKCLMRAWKIGMCSYEYIVHMNMVLDYENE